MKIHVPSIPEEGKRIPINGDLEWFRKMVAERFSDFCEVGAPASGEIHLLRTNGNVTLLGDLSMKLKPVCDRCAQPYSLKLKVPLHRYLVPYFGNPDGQREEGEEIELNEEDLDFSTYHNEEIDLEDILAEEVFLALPMIFHCKENCAGLCSHCGANLNEGPCECQDQPEESPFAVLKGVNFPTQSK
jgi:uncharacterized protein